MRYDPTKHHRRSIRLLGYDYRQAGAYFVTTVCKDRELVLEDERFRTIAEETWLWLAERYEYVDLDEYVVMPNHLHGIVVIRDVGAHGRAPLPLAPHRPPRSLGSFVAGFKSAVTKRINEIRDAPGVPVWQRNYYEHVIRDEDDLDRVRRYIAENPLRWEEDPENPSEARPVGGDGRLGDHGGSPLRPDGGQR